MSGQAHCSLDYRIAPPTPAAAGRVDVRIGFDLNMGLTSSNKFARRLKWILLPLAGLLFVVPAGLYWLRAAREPDGRFPCPENLHQIGIALLIYSHDHQGRYPDTFADLMLAESLGPEVFICPSSSAVRSSASTLREAAADLSNPAHCSYIYAGKRMTSDAPAEAVLAYEPLENHQGDGINVLFGDGHTNFIGRAAAEKLIAELKAGHDPPEP